MLKQPSCIWIHFQLKQIRIDLTLCSVGHLLTPSVSLLDVKWGICARDAAVFWKTQELYKPETCLGFT
jgi:hypothetical protein